MVWRASIGSMRRSRSGEKGRRDGKVIAMRLRFDRDLGVVEMRVSVVI